MSNGIFLVDIDGVLLPKPLMWNLIEERFITLYPNRYRGEIRAFYNQHKGEKPNVDEVIEAGFGVYGPDFWKTFYEIDYRSIVTPGWEELKRAAVSQGLSPRVFSEGSKGRRPWMPGYVTDGFQPYKVEQLYLGVPSLIFEDKLAQLPSLIARWKQEGITRIVGLDDWDKAIGEMGRLGIEVYRFENDIPRMGGGNFGNRETFCPSKGERTRLPDRCVGSLDQMTAILTS